MYIHVYTCSLKHSAIINIFCKNKIVNLLVSTVARIEQSVSYSEYIL